VGVLTSIQNKLALMGLRPGLSSARPVQIKFEKRLGSATNLWSATNLYGTVALSFVIPSEAEGSAVPRTSPGNAKYYNANQIVISTGA
jgi:hypothetical protein